MIISCIVLAAMALAQTEAETYEFRHDGGVHFGTVEEHPGGVMVRFVEDAPWKDNLFSGSFRRADVEYGRETRTSRERRHREGWESRGFVNAAQDAETPRWVLREEAERAERAMAMAEGLADAGPLNPPEISAEEMEASPGPDGNVLRQYWPHGAIILVGVVLAGLVTRLLILPG